MDISPKQKKRLQTVRAAGVLAPATLGGLSTEEKKGK
jgi:hypothetical protein